jgi:hypothetical protein
MKMKSLFWTGVLLCSCLWAGAQGGEKKKTSLFPFTSLNTAGLILGDDAYSLALQSINGVRHKSWFGGIGVGLDYYYMRSVPVFVDLRKMVRPGIWPLFVYGDVGLNIPWLKDSDKEGLWYGSKINNGLYYDVGAGFDFPLKKGSIILSGGYSIKALHEVQTYPNRRGQPGMPEQSDFVDYKFSRIVIKAGFRF